MMSKVPLVLTALLVWTGTASATWSVIAVDTDTREVVMAAASCVDTDDHRMKNAIAVVVPGIGIATCQAAADPTGRNQRLVFDELRKGTEPREIIEMLSRDPAFQTRQFAMVDMEGRAAGHSGLSNGFVAEFRHGRVPGTGIYYAVQGNILRAGGVVAAGERVFVETQGTLADRAMASLEAGDRAGGDSRCTCPEPPEDESTPAIPCTGRTSHVAYVLWAEAADRPGEGYNDGDYKLYIPVSQPSPDHRHGVKTGEDLNPVRTLRMRFDAWRATPH